MKLPAAWQKWDYIASHITTIQTERETAFAIVDAARRCGLTRGDLEILRHLEHSNRQKMWNIKYEIDRVVETEQLTWTSPACRQVSELLKLARAPSSCQLCGWPLKVRLAKAGKATPHGRGQFRETPVRLLPPYYRPNRLIELLKRLNRGEVFVAAEIKKLLTKAGPISGQRAFNLAADAHEFYPHKWPPRNFEQIEKFWPDTKWCFQ